MYRLSVTAFLITLPLILFASEPIIPLPQVVSVDMKKVRLGKALFFDPILSQDGTVSCSTCHHLEEGGDDGLQFSFGIKGQKGIINTPTVYNAVFNFRQFWDGRAKDLHEQAEGPIINPIEMGNDFETIIATLKQSNYVRSFELNYEDGVTKANILDTIAEFEKTLITPDAPFDRYLRGDKAAISLEVKEGYALFKSKGCIACHHGMNVGGNLYNKFGVMESTNSADLGRFNVTNNEQDKYFFKVPSLRNVAHTAPYFHDGRSKTLADAVRVMAKYQLGRTLSEQDVDKIVLFLHSLSGELPESIK